MIHTTKHTQNGLTELYVYHNGELVYKRWMKPGRADVSCIMDLHQVWFLTSKVVREYKT